MADAPSSSGNPDPDSLKPEPSVPNPQPDPAQSSAPPSSQQQPISRPSAPEPCPPVVPQTPQTVPPYAQPPISGASAGSLPPAPSYRPVPQFPPVSNQSYQNPSVPTPAVQPPGVSSATVMAPVSMPYQVPLGQVPNPAMRPYVTMPPNGYAAMPGVAPQGTVPSPGLPRYPSPYPTMVRPGFPLRPPAAISVQPGVPRPPVPGMAGVRPVIPPVVRPAAIPSVTPAEKPQTTVYVGKIAPTVENDFMLSLLELCGPIKSWKRAQDPTTGTPKSFGFYEFESAEGVLRALRLLNKFSMDGQELMLNVNQATKKYLEHYVAKKIVGAEKSKEDPAEGSEKEVDSAESHGIKESAKISSEETKNGGDAGNKDNIDVANSALVTDEDREADKETLEKIKSKIEERLKSKPPPPPPPPAADGSGNASLEPAVKSRDGESDADLVRSDAADETSAEHRRPEAGSPDTSRKHDRRSRDRDKEREKEQEVERYEREAERERARKEREQRRKMEDAERAYQNRLRQWERREREKEKERQYEKEREKEKERKRKKEIRYDEEEDDDEDDSRRRWHRSALEEKRRRRQWEKEDDLADKLKEEEENAESKKKAEEKPLKRKVDTLQLLSSHAVNGNEQVEVLASAHKDMVTREKDGKSIPENHVKREGPSQNGSGFELKLPLTNVSDIRQSGGAPAKKLGFGLVGSGKRTAVPSVFHEEEDESQKEKRMRPLVPIDYSTEELQAVEPTGSGSTPPHLAAAAEFAKRISNVTPKDETFEFERERNRRSQDKSGHKDRDRTEENVSTRDSKDKGNERNRDREHGVEKAKTPDNKKLLDAKQLIDTIPKTKDELFSYEINWTIYDKHQLHERMRPWISKKIMEFLGEEENTLVDYIVSNTREHVKASQMLELLQSILDEEAEMFVLKMWRMLIFEIKRVEAGLPVRSKS